MWFWRAWLWFAEISRDARLDAMEARHYASRDLVGEILKDD
jgi:hypothetical protein